MALEFALGQTPSRISYEFDWASAPATASTPLMLDWAPMLQGALNHVASGADAAQVSAGFHHGLINAIVGVAQKVGIEQVALTGGCFQNRYLTEGAVRRLRDAGFSPLWHQHVPPNDGGLALGQAVWASRLLQAGTI
jgi:hydrogenase maturation protein HypF